MACERRNSCTVWFLSEIGPWRKRTEGADGLGKRTAPVCVESGRLEPRTDRPCQLLPSAMEPDVSSAHGIREWEEEATACSM